MKIKLSLLRNLIKTSLLNEATDVGLDVGAVTLNQQPQFTQQPVKITGGTKFSYKSHGTPDCVVIAFLSTTIQSGVYASNRMPVTIVYSQSSHKNPIPEFGRYLTPQELIDLKQNGSFWVEGAQNDKRLQTFSAYLQNLDNSDIDTGTAQYFYTECQVFVPTVSKLNPPVREATRGGQTVAAQGGNALDKRTFMQYLTRYFASIEFKGTVDKSVQLTDEEMARFIPALTSYTTDSFVYGLASGALSMVSAAMAPELGMVMPVTTELVMQFAPASVAAAFYLQKQNYPAAVLIIGKSLVPIILGNIVSAGMLSKFAEKMPEGIIAKMANSVLGKAQTWPKLKKYTFVAVTFITQIVAWGVLDAYFKQTLDDAGKNAIAKAVQKYLDKLDDNIGKSEELSSMVREIFDSEPDPQGLDKLYPNL